MALNANKVPNTSGPRAEVLDPGNYPARIVQVLDLGLQTQRPYKGQEKPPVYEVMMTYELTTEFMLDEDGNPDPEKPRWISERFPLYSLSADKAKSTLRYNAIDPAAEFGGDFSCLVGKAVLVNLVNNISKSNGKTYNNVAGVSQPIKGMDVAEPVNPTKTFDMDDPDPEVFESLPEWIQGIMKENLEYTGSRLAEMLGDGAAAPKTAPPVEDKQFESDDVPF